jgi:putative transposase
MELHAQEFEIRKMCKVLQVSSSGYYAWKKHKISQREKSNQNLLTEIKRIHVKSRESYGTLKTWKALNLEGIACGKHRVARLRQRYKIESKRRRRFKITTQSRNTKWIAPNLLDRCFKTQSPNEAWVGDVTFIPTQSGWLYLAVLLDLYSRKVIGWSMSERNNRQLVLNALEMALKHRQPKTEVLHHTDRGSVYGSDEYQARLAQSRIKPSMSRKGDCYDNAVAESFFSTLKNELLNGKTFPNRSEARSKIFDFIEIFYNRQRLHQSLNYNTPEQVDQLGCVA